MDTNGDSDFIIVGGGCIGASTVYAIIKEWPDARVAWYSGTQERTASNDFIKIIRDAYPEDVIAKFANRALQRWMDTQPYSDHFHKTAWIQAIGKDTKKTMSKGQHDEALTAAEMIGIVGSVIEPTLDEGEELYLNSNVGYADSARAVQAVSDKAVKLGVARYEENVTRLIIENRRCLGVEIGGSVVKAEKTIVSAGAWTPGLLEKSNISSLSDFFVVAAVGVAVLPLSEAEFDSLKWMPILVTENGEVMLSRHKKVLKITTTETFLIGDPDKLTDAVDITANREVLEKMLPQFKGRELESFICPDLITPYQNPIVDHVPGVEQLIVATGGSYHSYKFLTNIGDMVIQRIRGQDGRDHVERTLLERWRWERPEGTASVHPNIIPQS